MNSPDTVGETSVESLTERITPHLVNLTVHGSSITITFLLGGKYYTAENIRPDFPLVEEDAELSIDSRQQWRALLSERSGISLAPGHSWIEFYKYRLMTRVMENEKVTFGSEWQELLSYRQMQSVKVTNYSYYHMLKDFVAAWQQVAKMIDEA